MSEGATFGAYRVVRKLGQGGMGAVYLAEHQLIGRRAAIKVLRRERSAQRDSVERFFNEARATSAVEDPGIVQIYDFGVTDTGTAYLVMEYLDGEPLSARLRRLHALSAYDAVRITRQLAGSLAATHAAGIVHRDLKPENLFMVRDAEALGGERPKILDFGIAKLAVDRSEPTRTRPGEVFGTPAYMSPEQCNAGKIDHRTDIYALGCVMYHLLVGRPPFDFEGIGATIAAHLREPAPAPSAHAPHVPSSVDAVVAQCLAKRPDDRYVSMLELQLACDALLPQLPIAAPVVGEYPSTAPTRPDETTTLAASAGQSVGPFHTLRVGAKLAVAIAAVAIGVVLALVTARRASHTTTEPTDRSAASASLPVVTPAPVVTPVPVAPPSPAPVVAPSPAPVTPSPVPVAAPKPEPATPTAPPAPAAVVRPTRPTTPTSAPAKHTPKKKAQAPQDQPDDDEIYEDRI